MLAFSVDPDDISFPNLTEDNSSSHSRFELPLPQ
jgi:hypothetical protein